MPASGRVYTSSEVQRITGVPQQQLTYWHNTGLIRPHGSNGTGRGNHNVYTVADVVILKVIQRLRDAGMSLQRIRNAFTSIVETIDDPAPMHELEIVSDGRRILVVRSDENLIDPITRQFILRLSLSELLAEVEREGSPVVETLLVDRPSRVFV